MLSPRLNPLKPGGIWSWLAEMVIGFFASYMPYKKIK
jgi:hypothetical protein